MAAGNVWFTALLAPRKTRESEEFDITFCLDEDEELDIYTNDKPYDILKRVMKVVASRFPKGRENEIFQHVREQFYIEPLRSEGLWFSIGDSYVNCKSQSLLSDLCGSENIKAGGQRKMRIFRSNKLSANMDAENQGKGQADLGMAYRQKALDQLRKMTESNSFPKREKGLTHLQWGMKMVEASATVARLHTKVIAKHDIGEMTRNQVVTLLSTSIKKKVDKSAPGFIDQMLDEQEKLKLVKYVDVCAGKIVDQELKTV